MDPPITPYAILSTKRTPCYVCKDRTPRLRSISHLSGPPMKPEDAIPICITCDAPWTAAVLVCLTA